MARSQQAQQAPPKSNTSETAEAKLTTPEVRAAQEAIEQADGEFTLAEMSRIMDVATTLRKEQELVEQQLNIDQVKEQLRQRLLEAAKVSGDPVSTEQVDAAVEHYYDRLHTFEEPPLSVSTALAHLYVRRTTIMTWAIAIAAVAAAFWGMYLGGVFPGERRDTILSDQAYAEVKKESEAIKALSDEPDVLQEASKLVAAAGVLQKEHKPAEMAEVTRKLAQLRAVLNSQYELTIPSTPNEESAFAMDYTDANAQTKESGFYVVVDARAPDGTAVRAPIRDRQTGKTSLTSRWAEQIPESVFNRLEADKKSDGLLDERTFGIKKRGARSVEVKLSAGEQPLERGGQLTQW